MRLGAIVAVVGLSLLPALRPVAAQQPTFSSRVEAITVDVLVTDAGRHVTGLGADDFVVSDNGVPQRVTVVSYAQVPLSVVLALDTSDSVRGDRLRDLQRASVALLEGLKESDRCGLLTFSRAVRLDAPLADRAAVAGALARITTGGSTSLYDAAYAGLQVAESAGGRALLIVFSDGADTSSFLTRVAVQKIARRTDVVVYAVAPATARRERFLRDVTDETAGGLIEVDATTQLSGPS